jgi:hypothetical protein
VSLYEWKKGTNEKSHFTLCWVALDKHNWRLKLQHWEREYYSDDSWTTVSCNADMERLLRIIEDHYVVDFDFPTTADTLPHLFFPARLYVDRPCLGSKELRFHTAAVEQVLGTVRRLRRDRASADAV